jgi:hypothetical protein
VAEVSDDDDVTTEEDEAAEAAEFESDAEFVQLGLGPDERRELSRTWARDPAKFCGQVFDKKPREFQPALLRLVRDAPRTAVRACRKAGKTAVAAYAALWWLCTRPGGLVVTTAPTQRQVEKVLWVELRSLWAAGILSKVFPMWNVLTTEIQTHRVDWRAIGFSSDSPDRIEGLHGGPVLVVYDEAKAITRETYESFQGMFASDQPWRQLAISTPASPVGWFYDAFYGKESGIWNGVTIRADEIPRLAEKCEEERNRLGEENAIYRRQYLAEFAGEEHGQLLPLALVEEAVDRPMRRPEGVEWEAVLAVDPAGTGGDETVVCFRVGPVVKWLDAWQGWDEMATVGEIVKIWRSLVPVGDTRQNLRIIVDRPGLGSPIISRLRELGLPVEDFNPGARAPDPEQHANLKTAVAFGVRDRFFAGEISIPSGLLNREPDRVLVGQLASYTVMPTSRGQDRIVDPVGDSPDRADAVLIAFSSDILGGGIASANVRGL